MKNKRTKFAGLLASFFMAGSALVTVQIAAPAPAYAQQEEGEQQPRRASQTLDTNVALVLQKVFEMTAAEPPQLQAALAELNKLIAERGDRMKAFDKATVYEFRGSVKAQLEDYRGALADFQVALQANALPPERNNQLRYFIAQIQFQLEDYQSAIRGLQEWVRAAQAAGTPVDCNAYYLLAAAYIQIQPPNYRSALPYGEQALACRTEPNKSTYDLLNLIYSELGENAKRSALLEKMINFWPAERGYWTQLSGLYSTTGKDSDAFAVLEVAYRAGLLKNESEMLTLVQYYSFFDNPYRGAKLLEREMTTGTVKRTVKNLTLLSQLWSQAREHKRAIPVLQEASRMSDSGELSYRLGQVLLADEQYQAAERALQTALRKGGLTSKQAADARMLLGTAIFSQAGPGDRGIRCRARPYFVQARNYNDTRTQANQWVTYIDAINSTEEAQDRLEWEQRQEARRADIERLRTQAQVCRLQGGSGQCEPILAQIRQLEGVNDPAPKAGGACVAGGDAPARDEEPEAAEEPAEAEEAPAEPQ